MRDIVERLEQIAQLRRGEMLPMEICDRHGDWSQGMSALLKEAVAEIRRLRATSGES